MGGFPDFCKLEVREESALHDNLRAVSFPGASLAEARRPSLRVDRRRRGRNDEGRRGVVADSLLDDCIALGPGNFCKLETAVIGQYRFSVIAVIKIKICWTATGPS